MKYRCSFLNTGEDLLQELKIAFYKSLQPLNLFPYTCQQMQEIFFQFFCICTRL